MQFNGYRIVPVFPKFGVSVENKCAVCSEKNRNISLIMLMLIAEGWMSVG